MRYFVGMLVTAVVIGLVAIWSSVQFGPFGGGAFERFEDQIADLHAGAKYDEALSIARQELPNITSMYGDISIEVASTHRLIAILQKEQEAFDGALSNLDTALKILDQLDANTSELQRAEVHNELGVVHERMANYATALEFHSLALPVREKHYGPESELVAQSINNIGVCYYYLGDYVEAEQKFLQSLRIKERVLEETDPAITESLNNLASIYDKQGRFRESEPLFRRVLKIDQDSLPENHPYIGSGLNNLADTLTQLNKYEEAERFAEEAIAVFETAHPPGHRFIGDAYSSLALIQKRLERFEDAETNYLVSKAIYEGFGEDNLFVAQSYNDLGQLERARGSHSDADQLLSKAIDIRKERLGDVHSDVAISLRNQGYNYLDWGREEDANQAFSSALDILETLSNRTLASLQKPGSSSARSELALNGPTIEGYLRSSWHLYQQANANGDLARARNLMDRAFQYTQWAKSSKAADMISKMSARLSISDETLAALLRERQDLLMAWSEIDAQIAAERAKPLSETRTEAIEVLLPRQAEIVANMEAIDAQFAASDSGIGALAIFEPSSISQIQALLSEDEIIVATSDINSANEISDTVFVWAITRNETRWLEIELSAAEIEHMVAKLRCGLIRTSWYEDTSRANCVELVSDYSLVDELASSLDLLRIRPLPYDLETAHELYRALFESIHPLAVGKHLIFVPSGALTSLPPHALVTHYSGQSYPETNQGYRDAEWLTQSNPISVLPSVGALEGLRETSTESRPNRRYLGYGNPVLEGNENCPTIPQPFNCDLSSEVGFPVDAFRSGQDATIRLRSIGGTVDAEEKLKFVKSLCPLPDSAHELQCVAETFDQDSAILRLGADATEQDLISRSDLHEFDVIHFATHGLLAGSSLDLLIPGVEPALVLTPGDSANLGSSFADGLLTMSEISTLQLDADWIILSACNTAAGDSLEAEALSGLARAFFYAGAQSLLVSHWPVNSIASTRMTVAIFDSLEQNPGQSKAAAHQYAIETMLLGSSDASFAHPSVWAPFIVVGEGG